MLLDMVAPVHIAVTEAQAPVQGVIRIELRRTPPATVAPDGFKAPIADMRASGKCRESTAICGIGIWI